MRKTAQKNLIYEIIQSSCDHPTAESIYMKARVHMPNISLGTVYRNLNDLVEMGKITRLSIPGEGDHYDHKMRKPHGHFYCQICKCFMDIEEIDVEPIIASVEQKNQVKIYANQISFSGVCPTCQIMGKEEKENGIKRK